MIIIGWDVSTAAIGVCIQRPGQPPEFNVIFPKGKTPLQKWRSAAMEIQEFMLNLGFKSCEQDEPITHVIEERLGGFTGGLTTKQTLMALAAMNAVVSHTLSYYGDVVHIAPVTTKRITGLVVDKDAGEDKKQAVIKLARSSCESFPYAETSSGKWVKGTDDMADAWLLAEAYSKVLKGEATLGSKPKAKRPKKKAGGAKPPKG